MEEIKNSGVKTLDKLVAVLDSFTLDKSSWSLAGLSAHLGIPKSSLHRFLTGLEHHGMLRRDFDDGRWHLGYRLFTWGSLVPEITDLRQISRPIMRELVAATGASAILTIYDNREVVCVAISESSRTVRMTLFVGTRRHAHAGASSKILMAYLPDEEIQAIITEKGLPKLSTNTITDPEKLQNELSRIRKLGYAMSHEETDVGAWGVAFPIRDSQGEVTAAIGVAGPYSRHSKDVAQRYIELCQQAARKIAVVLSGGNVDEGLDVSYESQRSQSRSNI